MKFHQNAMISILIAALGWSNYRSRNLIVNYSPFYTRMHRILIHVMPAVHSRRVCSARFSSEKYSWRGCVSLIFYTRCDLSIHPRMQIEKNYHHRPLEKWELTRWDTSTRGRTRASKARRVFPSTFSLSPCLWFSRQKCTAGISLIFQSMLAIYTQVQGDPFRMSHPTKFDESKFITLSKIEINTWNFQEF